MNTGKLEKSRDAVAKAYQQEPIESRGVFNFRQVLTRIQTNGRQRQHRCYTFRVSLEMFIMVF